MFFLSFFLVQPLFYLTMVIAFDHTKGHTTVGRTPLDEGSARRIDFYLTTHNTYNRQTSIPPAGFEPAIPAGDGPQTLALDRSATGIALPCSEQEITLHNTVPISSRTSSCWQK